MRAPALALTAALLLAAGLSPASAQLSGGAVGSANATNQSFQQQNANRNMQQQNNFNANQNRLQNSTNSMNTSVRSGSVGTGVGTGGYVAPRGRHVARPERER